MQDLTPPSSTSKTIDLPVIVRARIQRAPARSIPMAARALLDVLLEEAGADGEIHEVSVSELAERADMSRRSAQYVLRGLEAHGWISTKHIKRTRRMNERSIYRLLPAGRPWTPKHYPRLSSRAWGLKNSGSGCAKKDAGSGDPSFPGFAGGTSRVIGSDGFVVGSEQGHERGDAASADPKIGQSSQPNPQTPQKTEPSDIAEGEGPPKAEEDLDILGPPIPHVPRAREDTTLEEIRAALASAGLSDVIGAGFEGRLRALGMKHALKHQELLRRIAIVGTARATAIFNAAGKPTIWAADPSIQRGAIFKKITWIKDHVGEDRGRARVEPSREIRIARMVQRTIASCDHARREHSDTMREAVRKVKETLEASYFGVKPLEEHATDANAEIIVGQHTTEGANGGRLALADAIATIKLFATYTAFKVKRNEPVLPAMTWRFLMAEIRKAKPNCAAELNKKLASMKFYEPRAQVNRQPDTPPEMREALNRSMKRAQEVQAGTAPTEPAKPVKIDQDAVDGETLLRLSKKQADSPDDYLAYETFRISLAERSWGLSPVNAQRDRERAQKTYERMINDQKRTTS